VGDSEVYRNRYEKTATALIAVQRALEHHQHHQPLGVSVGDFLRDYAMLANASPEIFTRIWEDPFSYFWARRAYELVGVSLQPAEVPYELQRYCVAIGASNPREALTLHLQQFKRFLVALDLMTGATRRFDQPLVLNLPASIPGTPYSILGTGPIRVVGVVPGALEVEHSGRILRLASDADVTDSQTPRIVRRPTIQYGDLELTLKPETFCLPSVGPAAALFNIPAEFQQQQIPILEHGLALIRRHHPEAFQHMSDLIKVIAMKPPAAGDYSNVSLSDFPGAFILSALPQPYWIADSLIHELYHNRMFFITEDEPVFADSEPDGDADDPGEFYSPWRTDLRPLSGLLHALYVYTEVCKFWFSVWQSGETNGPLRAYVQDQAVRWMSAIKIGAHQLRKRTAFTEFGEALFTEMEKEVASLSVLYRTMGLSREAPAMLVHPNGEIVIGGTDGRQRLLSIMDTIRQHQSRYDIHQQCTDLDAILN
jgi:HEXXH motif-containing protein